MLRFWTLRRSDSCIIQSNYKEGESFMFLNHILFLLPPTRMLKMIYYTDPSGGSLMETKCGPSSLYWKDKRMSFCSYNRSGIITGFS